MSAVIIKHRYETSVGYKINSTSNSIFEWLSTLAQSVEAPSADWLAHNKLKPKSEFPGFCVATLLPKYDSTRCFIKAEAMSTTDVLVLDIDDVPSGVANIGLWIPTILPSGVKALWYTTPRYRDTAKRIRLVIRLNREISAAEKKSLETRLKIPGVDPASFEINKFSLLPCWCEDTVDFHWGTVGNRELNVDSDLPRWVPSRPAEWRDAPRLKACKEAAEDLEKLVEEINDAPDGGSQPVIKGGLSKIFRKYAVSYGDCEMYSNFINRDDRCKDFLGLARWLDSKYKSERH